ncbi:metallophosphoesterase, partial [Clostridioides difficile]
MNSKIKYFLKFFILIFILIFIYSVAIEPSLLIVKK